MTETFGPYLYRQVRFHQFPGFYDSHLSGMLDREEEQTAEHEAGDRQDEDGIPEELRLTEEKFGEILMECADYAQMHEDLAEAYTEALDDQLSEFLDCWAGVHFHSLWSPGEYNYSTDQLDIWVPEPTLRNLMVRSLANNHEALGALVKESFTPRSGFIPNYTAELNEWISRPFSEWDDIELGVLIEAVTSIGLGKHEDPIDKRATEALYEGETAYNIYSNNVDWSKFDEKVAEARAELEEEHRKATDPDYVPPPLRCRQTIDMFHQERYAA